MMLEATVAPRTRFLACAALLVAGCTMCPDPYDYSGPVPNGSAPQNDFEARSNGILPTGASPRPFPPVVKAEEQPTPADPAVTEPVAEPIAEQPQVAAGDDDVLRLSAEQTVIDIDDVQVIETTAAPLGVVETETKTESESEPVAPAEPAPRETPGWRARR